MCVKILCNERSRIDFRDFSVMMKTEDICHKKMEDNYAYPDCGR